MNHFDLNSSTLTSAGASSPKTVFGGWSPKMFVAHFNDGRWDEGMSVVTGSITLDPAASGIQFSQSVFEGICVERSTEGDSLFFRLDMHWKRFARSCRRLCIPEPPQDLFRLAVMAVSLDPGQWRTPFESNLLYIRPIVLGTTGHIIPKPSKNYLFIVLAAPFKRIPKQEGLTFQVDREHGRTANGGLGFAKTGANYAPLHSIVDRIQGTGIDGTLWLDATTHRIIKEVDVANIFFEMEDRLITPPLDDHVLPGITRDSVIFLARAEMGIKVDELPIDIENISTMAHSGALRSIFVTGTALGIHPVRALLDRGKEIRPVRLEGVWRFLHKRLAAIKQGREIGPHGWVQKYENVKGLPNQH